MMDHRNASPRGSGGYKTTAKAIAKTIASASTSILMRRPKPEQPVCGHFLLRRGIILSRAKMSLDKGVSRELANQVVGGVSSCGSNDACPLLLAEWSGKESDAGQPKLL
jgi:hypothetical protein